MNNLIELLNCGQSYWLDNLARKKITGGEIQKRVSEQGLRGITSNPSIFNKAIIGSNDYDEQIKDLVKEGKTIEQIYDALTIKDVQDACDILASVYKSSNGLDGFVSLEVSPYLARDTQRTISEARRLFKAVGRDNCMIKIPGTKEGLPAIEQMLYEGININITLLFSVERYVEVAAAFIRALNHRLAEGKAVNHINSVASVFVSRIDTLVDQLLGQRIIPSQVNSALTALFGKAGINSARVAYQQFTQIFSSSNWKELEKNGGSVQRLLWASTSNKDPLFSDVRYVETLIGKDTVNTLTDETITAFADHGNLKANTIEDGLDEAQQLFSQLSDFDIDINFVTQQLEDEGIEKFIKAYNELMDSLAAKRASILGEKFSPQKISASSFTQEVKQTYSSLDEKRMGKRLLAKDATLWETEPKEVTAILNRLGWLNLPDNFLPVTENIIAFAEQVKTEGYEYAVLLGMGGSSLCSEVARETFGTRKGYPQLLVLDNTSPEAIKDLEKKIVLEKTLFIVASKSGGTKETISFFKYFYHRLAEKTKSKSGNNFVAITDAGTPLVKLAETYKFRKVFINPSDIGGRYSVLSDFGILPMALMGIDVNALLTNAKQMKESCSPAVPTASNPGISLGVLLGICQKHGRDKITFVLSSSVSSFGLWLEQLIAESTGKEGRGLIPIEGEKIGTPKDYSDDRVFVHLHLATDDNGSDAQKISDLEKAGHPVVRIQLSDKIELGGEFFRWEVAIAIAGMIMNLNPFNEPNVAESKKNTDNLLEDWKSKGVFKKESPIVTVGDVSIYGSETQIKTKNADSSIRNVLSAFAALAKPHDYIALLPYFVLTDYRMQIFQNWRLQLREKIKVATTLRTGPRYLHSTGQLHKGGPATGLYIILIGEETEEMPIPDEKFGFGVLHEAQALGDFRSLTGKNRRVIYVTLGKNMDEQLKSIAQAFA